MGWNGIREKVCPPVVLGNKIRISAMGDQPDPNGWRRLPGYKVYPNVHVQPGRPVEKSEVLEVPTAVRNTGRGLLGGG